MTTDTTDLIDVEVVESAEGDDLAPRPRPEPERPSADINADADADSDSKSGSDEESTSDLPRAELLTGELWPEREVSRALVTTGIVCGVAGFALGYWLGSRERWSL